MKKAVFAVMIFLVASGQSIAAGMTTHVFMTEKALQDLAVPELKQLLESRRNTLLTACNFPDTGTANDYIIGHKGQPNYGGITHWPPYLESYLAYLESSCRAPYDRRCSRLIAHFMGTAAHDMEDQSFDELFLARAAKVAPAETNWMVDATSDWVLLGDYNRWDKIPVYVAPVKDLKAIFSGMGLSFGYGPIVEGHAMHHFATVGERAVTFFGYLPEKKKLAWIGDHIYSAPGGVEYTAGLIDKYWESLWHRLQGRDEEVIPVFSTRPAQDAQDAALDSEINVFFSRGKICASITPETFIVKDEAGQAVPGKVRCAGRTTTDVASFVPASPFRPDQAYTVILTTGLQDLDGVQELCQRYDDLGTCLSNSAYALRGKPMSREYSFRFSTVKN